MISALDIIAITEVLTRIIEIGRKLLSENFIIVLSSLLWLDKK